MTARDYAGGAVATTLTSTIASDTLSIAIGDATGWPTGSGGKFYVTLDRQGAHPEKILVLSRSGTTLTISTTGDRGLDGTTAAAHTAGVTVEHTIASPDVSEPNAHINNTALDHHTQYHNNARHDLTARHTAGTVVPTAPPGNIYPDDVAAEGVASTLARSDHTHAISTVTPSASAVGNSGSEGSDTTFARGDHQHARESAGAPHASAVGDSQATGSGPTIAFSDHVHAREAFATSLADISTASAAGSATTVPHGDHVHKGMGVDAWTDYSGTISLTNITMGSGSATVARYRQVGKTVEVAITLVLGTGGSITGNAAVSVPAASVNRASQEWIGTVDYVDTGTSHYLGGCLLSANSSTAILLSGISASNQGLTNGTYPFALGNTDRISLALRYESA